MTSVETTSDAINAQENFNRRLVAVDGLLSRWRRWTRPAPELLLG
jgi:hypothetical protein